MKKTILIFILFSIKFSQAQNEANESEITFKNDGKAYFHNVPFTGIMYSDEKANNKCKCTSEAYYRAGKLNGYKREWYKNGKLKYEAKFSYGKLISEPKFFDKNENLIPPPKKNATKQLKFIKTPYFIADSTDILYPAIDHIFVTKKGIIYYNDDDTKIKYITFKIFDGIQYKLFVDIGGTGKPDRFIYGRTDMNFSDFIKMNHTDITANPDKIQRLLCKDELILNEVVYDINKTYIIQISCHSIRKIEDVNEVERITEKAFDAFKLHYKNSEKNRKKRRATRIFRERKTHYISDKIRYLGSKSSDDIKKNNFEQNLSKAQSKALLGNNNDKYNYAELLFKNKQYTKAFMWYSISAQTNFNAQYKLGIMYLKGLGTTKNIIVGKRWLKKACKNGVFKACNELNKIRK